MAILPRATLTDLFESRLSTASRLAEWCRSGPTFSADQSHQLEFSETPSTRGFIVSFMHFIPSDPQKLIRNSSINYFIKHSEAVVWRPIPRWDRSLFGGRAKAVEGFGC